MTVIDTPEGIEHFRFVTLLSALSLETKGLKSSRINPRKVAREQFGATKRTTVDILTEMLDRYINEYGRRSTYDQRGSQDDVFCPNDQGVMSETTGYDPEQDANVACWVCETCRNVYVLS